MFSARFLLVVFDSVFVLALAAWAGSFAFFCFAVSPSTRSVPEDESTNRLIRVLLPRLHTWGAVAGAIALPSYVAVPLCYPEFRGPWVAVQAMIILGGILTMLYAANSLTPAIDAARDSGAAAQRRFEQLCRRSALINALMLAIGIGLLVAFANRPAPRTAGIQELSPAERTRREINAAQQRSRDLCPTPAASPTAAGPVLGLPESPRGTVAPPADSSEARKR
jgi:hypothetical protein